ncbi:hypothetical protein [Klebsiella phage KP8]|uniref:Uncharacterized protein n=1 Tax=Klebsiella phage KP8 TaxID=2099850 RepID=A0A2P1CDD4_9CAUD|nr:hypothetical protein HWB55_gp094 [Klebsiella phage KP8]AVJ48975.1 hypothetical protein [Klebsiella phage KP8]
MNTELLPYQQRVVEELEDLKIKIGNLIVFTTTRTFAELSASERNLLNTQLSAMKTYGYVLELRIAKF